MVHDYIVVGSGCSGAMAAQTLLDAGKRVLMLDVGETNPQYATTVPNKDYLTLRRTDPKQYTYFIGKSAQGVVVNDTGKGAQITPSREHMVRNLDTYIPLESSTFEPIESLGYGGLGIGWGLQCWEFDRSEIKAAGMDSDRIIDAYETVAERIGVSGTKDAAATFTLGELKNYQPSPKMDQNMQRIYDKYAKQRRYFDGHGIYMGRTPLALLTSNDQDERKKYAYRDMDFYDDNDMSGWRPWITVNRLRKNPNFTYISGFLATHFTETSDKTIICGLDTKTKKPDAYSCKRLILASGALGSARIALRSFADKIDRTPFLCNPYTYAPCIQPSMFGKGAESAKIGFGQLSAFSEHDNLTSGSSILTLYSYQSLMLFRIIRQAPLNFNDARSIMRYVSSGLVVAGIQHSDAQSKTKYLQFKASSTSLTGDTLQAYYTLSDDELRNQKNREDQFVKALRRVGLFVIKRMNPGHGSSVHYAGTLPIDESDKPGTMDARGKLHGTRAVYVADSSGFKFLPARGLTFTILANAHVTAQNVLQDAIK